MAERIVPEWVEREIVEGMREAWDNLAKLPLPDHTIEALRAGERRKAELERFRAEVAEITDLLSRPVLDLHAEKYGHCQGCDCDCYGYDWEQLGAEWPCRTVVLVAEQHGITKPL